MTVGERELLDAYRQSLRETIDFYSNRNKPARYLWGKKKGTFYFSDGNMTNCAGTVIQWNRNLRVSTFFQASGLPELQRPS